jgi:hypothetical protein
MIEPAGNRKNATEDTDPLGVSQASAGDRLLRLPGGRPRRDIVLSHGSGLAQGGALKVFFELEVGRKYGKAAFESSANTRSHVPIIV